MNKIKALILAGVFMMWPLRPAAAFNPIQDVLDNTTFPIGQQASAGTAINLRNGNTATSLLAGIADYRGLILLSAGATRDNVTGANFSDTIKIGFELGWLFSKFSHDLPPQGAFLKNINIGPSYGVSAFSSPGVGAPFFDINYTFK